MKGFCPGARLLYQLNFVCPASGTTFHLSRFWFARFAPPRIKGTKAFSRSDDSCQLKGKQMSRLVLLAILLSAFATAAQAGEFKVIRVYDGDTFKAQSTEIGDVQKAPG
jgi:hypothetical protein